jgi:hypothetical protein
MNGGRSTPALRVLGSNSGASRSRSKSAGRLSFMSPSKLELDDDGEAFSLLCEWLRSNFHLPCAFFLALVCLLETGGC